MVRSVFNATGIQALLQNSSSGLLLKGYFPCEKPLPVGFSLPSKINLSTASGTLSHSSTVFNIQSSLWAAVDNGENNCTAIVSGQNVGGHPELWVVGQRK